MSNQKFTIELGGRKRIFHINAGTLRAYDRAARARNSRPFFGGFQVNDMDDLLEFFLATLRPEEPGITLESLIEEMPLDQKSFAGMQLAILEAIAVARHVQIPAKALAALRAEIETANEPTVTIQEAGAPPSEGAA